MPPQQSGSVSASCKLYQDCAKLPLDIFIDCLLDNDLQQLIISGVATQDQLQITWDKIYIQYCQLCQDGSYNEVFETLKEINDLRAKIHIVNNIIQYLQICFDNDLVALLNSYALDCTLTAEDKGQVMITKLNMVVARMKRWLTILSQKEKKIEELREQKTGKITRAYFDEVLETLSDYKGYQLKSSELTVSRFCLALSKMNEERKQQQVKNIKHGR